jgi:hypothetical protein
VSPPEEEPIVTMKDIYREVVRLVGHMQGIDTRNAAADAIHADHEARLRMLERWRYGLPASIILGLGSAGVALASLLHH